MPPRRTRFPRWLGRLANELETTIQPLDPLGDLGMQAFAPAKGRPCWHLAIYPRLNELYGGAQDGRLVVPGFSCCVSSLQQLFDLPPHVDWTSPTNYSGNLDGPHLMINGQYARHSLVVCVFDQPPPDESVALVLDTLSGEVRPHAPCRKDPHDA